MAGVIAVTCLGLFWVSLFALSSFSIRQIDAWNGLFTQ
ncbi:iron ABC transporter, partial [Pseudomonas syringae pv. actinidiae]